MRAADFLRSLTSHKVLRILIAKNIEFLVSVPAFHSFSTIDWIRLPDKGNHRILHEPPDHALKGSTSGEVRVVRLPHPSGEESYYFTSLRRAHFSCADIATLYRKRWESELFKLEKSSYFGQYQFHAGQPHGVKQEILAQAIFVVLARFLQTMAAETLDADYIDLSTESAILGLADYLTRIVLDVPFRSPQWLPRLLIRIARTRDKRRPNRSFPRRSFKPNPRRVPTGRRGA